jgi:hypothetical protein
MVSDAAAILAETSSEGKCRFFGMAQEDRNFRLYRRMFFIRQFE